MPAYSHYQGQSASVQYQSQPASPQYQSQSNYPQYQSPSDSYSPNQPAYSQQQPLYPKPASNIPSHPPPPPRPFTQLISNVRPTQQNSNPNRFGVDQTTDQGVDQFSTRPTKKVTKPITTQKPPDFTANRFDDRDSASFKKRLTYDGELADGMEKFALELMLHFNTKLENDNFMMSPFSIYHLLVLIAEGANGTTYRELNEKLGLKNLARTRDFQQYLSVALK